MSAQIQFRRGTTLEWFTANPLLVEGELGIELDTGKIKLGNGVQSWNSLAYATGADGPQGIQGIQGIQGETGNAGLATTNSLLISPIEQSNVVSTGASGIINLDVIISSHWIYTQNATSNITLNIRASNTQTLNNLLSVGESKSVVFCNTTGEIGYYPNVFQIDGVLSTVRWAGGIQPITGSPDALDTYSFVITKIGSGSFLVIANQTRYA